MTLTTTIIIWVLFLYSNRWSFITQDQEHKESFWCYLTANKIQRTTGEWYICFIHLLKEARQDGFVRWDRVCFLVFWMCESFFSWMTFVLLVTEFCFSLTFLLTHLISAIQILFSFNITSTHHFSLVLSDWIVFVIPSRISFQ